MVPNCYENRSYLVTKATQKFGSHRLNSERAVAVQSLKMRHYTPVCDLVKIGAFNETFLVLVLSVSINFIRLCIRTVSHFLKILFLNPILDGGGGKFAPPAGFSTQLRNC